MSTSHLAWILTELARVGVRAVTFEGGGEPARGPLMEAVWYAWNRGIQSGVITNGTLLDPQITAIGKASRWCRISFDAGNKETHQKMHRGGKKDWEWMVNASRQLAQYSRERGDEFILGASFLLCHDNVDSLGSFIEFVNDLEFDYAEVKRLHGHGEDSGWLLDREHRLRNYADSKTKAGGTHFVWNVRPENYELAPSCYASRIAAPAIEPSGEVFVCCNKKNETQEDYSFGVWEEGVAFENIWHGPRRKDIAERIVSEEWNANEHCDSCKLRSANKMMHSAMNPSLHGDFI